MNRRAALLFLGLGIAWGIPYLLIKVAVEEISPATLVLARTLIGALVLLPVAFRRRQVMLVLRRWPWVLAFAVIEIAVPWVALGSAEEKLPSSITGLLIAAVPLVGVAVAYLTGRAEPLGRIGWAGLLVGILGVAALVGLDLSGTTPVPLLEVLVTVIGYAIGPAILARKLGDLPGAALMSVALSACAIGYAPVVLGTGSLPDHLPAARILLSIALLGVVCTAAAFVLMAALVNELGPVRATTITYVNPAVAIAAGAIVLGEQISGWTVVGFVLVLAGSFLVTRRPAARTEELITA